MTFRPPDKKAARALQKRTGWSYTECLRCIRELSPQEIEALIVLRGTKGDSLLKRPK